MIDEVVKYLECPRHKTNLLESDIGYVCNQHNHLYPKVDSIPSFLEDLDDNKSYQEEIWAGKTYEVDPKNYVFTTIQEHYGNRMLRRIKLPKNAVAVDIGSFIGEKLWQLSGNKDYLGIGVDIAIPSLIAASKIDKYGHKFLAADLENLPFKDNSIDFIMVFDVIEHLSNQEKGFSEISRVLKPGGRFLLHIPIKNNKYSFFWWKRLFFPALAKQEYEDVGHSDDRMLTTSEIKEYLKKYGLSAEEEKYYNSFFVHFFDREFSKFIAFVASRLMGKSEKSGSNYAVKTAGGSVGIFRKLYGKVIVPIFELLSFPDHVFSMFGIGNTYFVVSKKLYEKE